MLKAFKKLSCSGKSSVVTESDSSSGGSSAKLENNNGKMSTADDAYEKWTGQKATFGMS
jgi:hypothetical protein